MIDSGKTCYCAVLVSKHIVLTVYYCTVFVLARLAVATNEYDEWNNQRFGHSTDTLLLTQSSLIVPRLGLQAEPAQTIAESNLPTGGAQGGKRTPSRGEMVPYGSESHYMLG